MDSNVLMQSSPPMKQNKELLLFILLFLINLIHRLIFFDYFYMPTSDFLNTKDMAHSFIHYSIPDSFRSAPLYPFLVSLLMRFLPITSIEPARFYAEILNFFFFSFSLILIFKISKYFLKYSSLLVVWFFIIHPVTSGELINQPLIEDFLLFTSLLTLYLTIKKSSYSYLSGVASSLSRYEGFFLIPILCLKDIFTTKKIKKPLIISLLSSIPLFIWLLLSKIYTSTSPSYLADIVTSKASKFNFLKVTLFSLMRFLPQEYYQFVTSQGMTVATYRWSNNLGLAILIITSFFFFIILIYGCINLIRYKFWDIIPFLLYLFSYTLVHSFYPFTLEKHVFPVIWIYYLLFMKGTELIVEKFSNLKYKTPSIFFNFLGVAIGIILILYHPTKAITQEENNQLWTPLNTKLLGKTKYLSERQIDIITLSSNNYYYNPYLKENIEKKRIGLTNLDSKFLHDEGFSYLFPIPDIFIADSIKNGNISNLILYEDDKPLLPHSLHNDIRKIGMGRFSHWENESNITSLFFSSSDNSNPNSNNRNYYIGNIFIGELSVKIPIVDKNFNNINEIRFFAKRASDNLENPVIFINLIDNNSNTLKKRLEIKNKEYKRYLLSIKSDFSLNIESNKKNKFNFENVAYLEFSIEKNKKNSSPSDIFIEKIEIIGKRLSYNKYLYIPYMGFILGFIFFYIKPFNKKWYLNFPTYFFLIILFHFVLRENIQEIVNKNEIAKYSMAQYVEVGKWYREVVKPDDYLLSRFPWIVRYSSRLWPEYFDSALDDYKSNTYEELIEELTQRRVTYVAWNSGELDFPTNKASLLSFLSAGKNFPNFKLVKSISIGPHSSYVYRFIPLKNTPPSPPISPISPKIEEIIPLDKEICLLWNHSEDIDEKDYIRRYRVQLCESSNCFSDILDGVLVSNKVICEKKDCFYLNSLKYDFLVKCKNDICKNFLYGYCNIKLPLFFIEEVTHEGEKKLYWRVKAQDNRRKWGKWSKIWSFTVKY